MCRITPNHPDKNPCAIHCPELNETFTVTINFDTSRLHQRIAGVLGMPGKRVIGATDAGWSARGADDAPPIGETPVSGTRNLAIRGATRALQSKLFCLSERRRANGVSRGSV
jgi:hypothetical protein